MARFAREEPNTELDLTPIMNMVLVLIPLMLLSVVFITITVINVSMPQRSAGLSQNDGEPPLRLRLSISNEGFWVIAGEQQLEPIEKCKGKGEVTVCMLNEEAELPVERYDWMALYNELMKIKQRPEWADHAQIEINASADTPLAVIIKALDVSRFQLVPRADYETATKGKLITAQADFDEAQAVQVTVTDENGAQKKTSLDLFPLVILGMPSK